MKDTIDFKYSIFSKGIEFSNSCFKENVYFGHSFFNSNTVFFRCTFEGNCSFYQSTIFQGITFDRTNFSKALDVSRSSFSGTIQFSRTVFCDYVDIQYVTFFNKQTTLLFGIKEEGNEEEYSRTVIKDKMNFSYSNLPDSISFSGSSIIGDVDFSAIDELHCSKGIKFNLEGCDAEKIILNYRDKGRFKFNLIRKLEPELSKAITLRVYSNLMLSSKNNQFREGYLNTYEENELLKADGFVDLFIFHINKIWWRFGYAKDRIIFWSLCFFFGFLVLNLLFFDKIILVHDDFLIN